MTPSGGIDGCINVAPSAVSAPSAMESKKFTELCLQINRFHDLVHRWVLLSLHEPVCSTHFPKFVSPQPEDRIPAIIYAFILTPLVVGSFLIFGYYAWRGEYDQSE